MIRGLHIAKTGMLTQQRRQENIANNIVNANTPGFKKATAAIAKDRDLFLHRLNDEVLKTSFGNIDRKPKVGPLGTGVFVDETLVNFSTGSLIETNNPLDLSIQGGGFFTLEGNGQTFLTRNGVFTTDSQGYVVNSDGFYLLGQNGRISLNGGEITIKENGDIFVDGNYIDTLQITTVQNPHSLSKLGMNLFTVTERTILGGPQGLIRQGFIEGSNVDLAEEMVELISTLRAYEANQKIIQTHDELLGKAVNEIASVR
ncbi:flagellar basal-body rod protein FlgG [Anaerobranca californiensis DSM 14826]|uniref:Flagellar basal-body rod protein FlgG n=1 Tax=Anaerobranca californiensis DSM 14826 TaxID=1120989 RepID=A0A1M6MBX9_9FIRM|nr:flagellar hook-basal body protein [Anaerobranca californiensis]SHJ80954.1 flagellar basal-body rod protein FlgG [Anaerobranca californiensis DSM 14826]